MTAVMAREIIDVDAAFQAAWDWCWKFNCEPNETGYRRQEWLTASDLERRVRAAAYERLQDLPEGKAGPDAYLLGVRIRGLGGRDLLSHARDWLSNRVRAGVLRAYHPSGPQHRTCTGLRFVPVNLPTTDAERKAAAVDPAERSRTVHGVTHAKGSDGGPLCGLKTKRSLWRRRPIRVSSNQEWVSCKKCRKLMPPVSAPESTRPVESVNQ